MKGFIPGTKVLLLFGQFAGDVGMALNDITRPGQLFIGHSSKEEYIDPEYCQEVAWDDGSVTYAPVSWLVPIDKDPDEQTIEQEDEVTACE